MKQDQMVLTVVKKHQDTQHGGDELVLLLWFHHSKVERIVLHLHRNTLGEVHTLRRVKHEVADKGIVDRTVVFVVDVDAAVLLAKHLADPFTLLPLQLDFLHRHVDRYWVEIAARPRAPRLRLSARHHAAARH